MCEVCQDIMVNVRKTRVVQYDPTRTTFLRNTAVHESNRRFNNLITLIKKAVDTEDVFGLRLHTYATPGKNAFAYKLDMQKIEEFNRWLQEQIDNEIFEVINLPRYGTSLDPTWLNKYITESYKRGVERARQELRKAGYPVPVLPMGIILPIMSVPLHVDAVGVLYIRAFNELKGITDAMSQLISRVLAQGIVDGVNAKTLARRLVSVINGSGVGELGITDTLGRFIPAMRRAEIMVRTELIRAHHYANINEYRNWSVYGVTVMAEFKTAGDARVCSICESMEGNIYTLDEVLPLIPVHPQCRCMAMPITLDKQGKRERYGN